MPLNHQNKATNPYWGVNKLLFLVPKRLTTGDYSDILSLRAKRGNPETVQLIIKPDCYATLAMTAFLHKNSLPLNSYPRRRYSLTEQQQKKAGTDSLFPLYV
jgi:hypothetical protein